MDPKVPTKLKARKKPLTKYDPGMCDTVRDLMAQGYSKTAVAGAMKVCRQTFHTWRTRHPAFEQAVRDGETLSLMWWENLGHQATRGEVPGFNAAVWIFSMKNLHGWKDKQELSTDKEAPLTINIVRHGQDKRD